MNWTDVFPVLDDAMVDEYEAKATRQERRELADWFAVEEVINPREVGHIVSVSLFWKNIRSHEPDIVIKDRAMFMGIGRRRKLLRFDPWHHYAEPLIKGALWVQANRPDVAFRVYLAADLVFLIPDLVIAGCEVYLMKTSSIRHNPGAMWRFLAFEETDKLVTLVDADRAARPLADLVRTETTAQAGLGFWRVPVWGELNDEGNLNYRPIVGCQMGSTKPFPARLLMEALVWQTRRGGITKLAKPPGALPVTIHGTVWPDYGFDEWFLQVALYPRAAFEGLLTFVPASAKSQLLPLDIEYAVWANAGSEIQYFGWADGGCCAPVADGGEPAAQEQVLPQSTLAGRRKKWQEQQVVGKSRRVGPLAALIFLSAEREGLANRQMVRLLVESLVATEFVGEILLWREEGEAVIAGKNAAEVTERQGNWSRAEELGKGTPAGAGKRVRKTPAQQRKITEEADANAKLWADPELAGYRGVLLLGPGVLACRNVEYLLEPETGWRTMVGRNVADSPVTAGKPLAPPTVKGQPKRRRSKAERDAVPSMIEELPQKELMMPVVKAFERGAIAIWDLDQPDTTAGKDESSTGNAGSAEAAVVAGTLLWVEAGDAAAQLTGVWHAWLARFAPAQAGVLASMVAGEHTRPARREERARPSLKTTRRSRTPKKHEVETA